MYDIKYNYFQHICARCSPTERCSDYTMTYPVLDLFKYAETFDEFRDEYPFLVIDTYCQALSGSTFGDQCKGKSGPLEFETINFNRAQYLNKYIVSSHESDDGYEVGAEIGIGFKSFGSTLFIQTFVNGWIYEAGAYKSCLDIGLGISRLAFIPKSQPMEVSLLNSTARIIGKNQQFEYVHT